MDETRTMDTGTSHVSAGVRSGVAELVLNRPDRRNALSDEMLAGLVRALDEAAEAEDVGAVLLTGAGKSFCAGGDVKEFASMGGAGASPAQDIAHRSAEQLDIQRAIVEKMYTMRKPVVAALPGAAAGAGIGLALAADLRVGTPRTVVVSAFASVGLSGDFGATWLLHRLLGRAKASQIMYLSERIDAQQCLDLGLLNWLVPEADLLDYARDVATRLARGPRLALGYMKDNLAHANTDSLAEAMYREVPRHIECGTTADHLAAAQAFVEKREPVFGAGAVTRTGQ